MGARVYVVTLSSLRSLVFGLSALDARIASAIRSMWCLSSALVRRPRARRPPSPAFRALQPSRCFPSLTAPSMAASPVMDLLDVNAAITSLTARMLEVARAERLPSDTRMQIVKVAAHVGWCACVCPHRMSRGCFPRTLHPCHFTRFPTSIPNS